MSKKQSKEIFQNASLIKRGIAYFIDWYIISILTIIPINIIYSIIFQKINFESTLMNLPFIYASLAWIIGFILTLIYLVYLPYRWDGMTIGKKICSIRIVKSDYSKIDFKTLFLRNGIGILVIEGTFMTCSIYFWELMNLFTNHNISSPALSLFTMISLISFGICVMTPHRSMIHDFIGHTRVISKS